MVVPALTRRVGPAGTGQKQAGCGKQQQVRTGIGGRAAMCLHGWNAEGW